MVKTDRCILGKIRYRYRWGTSSRISPGCGRGLSGDMPDRFSDRTEEKISCDMSLCFRAQAHCYFQGIIKRSNMTERFNEYVKYV